ERMVSRRMISAATPGGPSRWAIGHCAAPGSQRSSRTRPITPMSRLFPLPLALAFIAGGRPLSGQQVTAADYARAEQFLPANAMKKVRNAVIVPHWTKDERLWYQRETPEGTKLVLIDPDRNTRVDGVDPSTLPSDPPRGPAYEVPSPDGQWAAF